MSAGLAPDLGVSLDSVLEPCRAFGVRALDAFATKENGGRLSFAVTLDPADPRRIAPRRVGLDDGLDRLFGRPVEAIGPAALENRYPRRHVARLGQRVFPPP